MKKELLIIKNRAFSLIEVLIAIGLLSLFTLAIVGGVIYGRESSALSGAHLRAEYLANEGLEAARNIRDASFSNLTDGPHGLATSGGIFSFNGTSDTTDIFRREITVATINSNTKRIESKITWPQNLQRSGEIILTSYLTNWRASSTPPVPSWANPAVEATLDLQGPHDGYKIDTEGNYAYVARNQGNPSFDVVDINNPAVPVEVGNLNVSGSLFGVDVSGSYGYVASTQNNAELVTINVSNPASPSQTGVYNAAGNADARGIYYESSKVYLTRDQSSDPEFYIINVTNPAAPALLGSLQIAANVREVIVIGNYAYAAASADNAELQVINIANPAAPAVAAVLDLPGSNDGLSITGFGSTILLGRAGGPLNIINITNPLVPALTSTYTFPGNVEDVALGRANTLAFLVGNTVSQFQAVDINNLAAPALLGQLGFSAEIIYGVCYHDAKDRAFIVGDGNNAEFRSIKPQ